jgi:phospholipase C
MPRPRMFSSWLVALLALTLAPAIATATPPGGPLGHFKHLVVIYEENHSFDNLYGLWGPVGGEPVQGLSAATPAHTLQVAQDGTTYDCLLMTDVNLMSPPRSPDCSTDTFSFGAGKPTTAYHFGNAPYNIDPFIPATATTCPDRDHLFSFTFGVADGNGLPGGCTRDLVHRFYQEQYQLDGGAMDRYVTGSDSAGMTMGYYDTTKLPIYRYLHQNGAPNYVIADHLFQAAFGGSFLNHQYLIAAAAPASSRGAHSVLDANGFPNASYPLYHPASPVTDGPLTQACGLDTTVAGLACGDFAVNTMQPPFQPTSIFGTVMPAVDDTTKPMNIGDEMTDAGVSWAWYSGGWDDASGNKDGRGWTGTDTACGPDTAPAPTVHTPDGDITGGFPFCPDKSFQTHHQPFNYFARYAPGSPDRSHLQDEQDFLHAVSAGELPQVSFVKPLGLDNEHPGYTSEPRGSDHLVDLIRAIETGPQAGNTLIVVTYDEFGGQWDHVSPPGLGTPASAGQADLFGPGTRVPALLIARSLTTSTVDHDVYDTTSILRTIEAQYGLAPLTTRDASVRDLGPAISAGRHGH